MQQYAFIRVNRLFKRYTPKHLSTVCYICDCDDLHSYQIVGTMSPHLLAKYIRNYLRQYKGDSYRLADNDELVFAYDDTFTKKIPKMVRRFIIDNKFKDVYFFAIGNFFPYEIREAKRQVYKWLSTRINNGFVTLNIERGQCLRG